MVSGQESVKKPWLLSHTTYKTPLTLSGHKSSITHIPSHGFVDQRGVRNLDREYGLVFSGKEVERRCQLPNNLAWSVWDMVPTSPSPPHFSVTSCRTITPHHQPPFRKHECAEIRGLRNGWPHRMAIMTDRLVHRKSPDEINTNVMINGREDRLSAEKTLSLNLHFESSDQDI
jgi:hypothetical protein